MLKRLLTRKSRGGVPLYLNIYDITPINGYLYWLGLGIYHSAVEAHGLEYAFGGHDFSSSGIFEVEPRSYPGFQFRRRVKLGTIQLDSKDFREFMVQLSNEYSGNTYNLMMKNCNHFCNDVSLRLTGSSIPGWVNRLAKLGNLCVCFLPVDLHVTTLAATPDDRDERNNSSMSSRPRVTDYSVKKSKKRCRKVSSSTSSSPTMKGRRPPWNWKHPTLSYLKFRKL
ncbi:hypothetical protein GOP47_0023819 [Adiantum capillus-veneris]|uniref:PPPDE domain-containing protein n=1 Tax=Adiantum capillus-veneris TaxID=13818 RepID=A0A9D4Z4U0_ADICA|nr:hypothetical protein GOP47_0023819 [Adiantum capillus-veneris]